MSGVARPDPFVDWPQPAGMKKEDYNVRNYIRLFDHVGKIVDGLLDDGDLEAIDRKFAPHDVTYLKLILLVSYARQFLKFGAGASDWYYLDILSSSGLSYAPDYPQDPIPASALLAPLAWQVFQEPDKPLERAFTEVHCFEMDDGARGALERRYEAMRDGAGFSMPPAQFHGGDANASLIPVLDRIAAVTQERRSNRSLGPLTLAFVDNLSMNIGMDAIKAIQTKVRADLVIHLPTRAIWRCIEANRKGGTEQRQLTRFFGTEDWKNLTSKEQVPQLYHEQVRAATGQDFQEFEPVHIRGLQNDFHLCVYVRHTRGTKGKAGWTATIRKLAEACNRLDYSSITRVKETAVGRQQTLF